MDSLSPTQLANIEFHKQIVAQYDRQPFFQESNRQRIHALLVDLCRKTAGRRLLDVGCGTGLILDLAHDIFDRVDGIDITAEMLERVTLRANVSTRLASAEEIPFPANTFDVITAYSVLHHIDDIGRVLQEIRRTLKPGGFFYADESPSQDYLNAFLHLNIQAPMSDSVQRERNKLLSDADAYKDRYGIDSETVRRAMAQNYSRHTLTQEAIESTLHSAGFEDVQFFFRRFVGEDLLHEQGGPEAVRIAQEYLVSVLPLTRHLFKYFVLIAK